MEMVASPRPFSLAEPIGFLFLYTVLTWAIIAFRKLSLRLIPLLQPHSKNSCFSWVIRNEVCGENSSNEAQRDLGLSRKDVEMVMSKIGLNCSCECKQMDYSVGSDELTGMFEEEEPSLEEVKEAFCVFDEGRDGFIDAVKLQIVMLQLGFSEGMTLDACKEMIAVYDEDRDGRIGFQEFVKLMESGFC